MPPLLRDVLRPHRRTLLAMLSATLVQMTMTLAVPWPLKSVLDNVVGNHPAPLWITWMLPLLGGHDKVHVAEAAGLLTVLIAGFTATAMYAGSFLTESLGQSIGNDLRVRLYHHLQELSLAYHESNGVGTLLSTLTADVQTVQGFASTTALSIVTDTLSLIAMSAVMFWLRWDFALIALAATPLLVAFVLRVNRAVRVAVVDVRIRQSDLLATLQEGLQSIEVVKAFTGERRQEERLRVVGVQTATAWLQARRASALLSPTVTLAIAVCTGLVLWRGSLLVLSGVMTIGELSVFLAYLARFFSPVRNLVQMANTVAQVSVGYARVTALCDADRVIPERPAPRRPATFRGDIAFEHVSFSYNADVAVLRDITFQVGAGETVGIVGPTGSGKSTILSMIARFRDPDAGHITIDGVDVRDFTLHGLRTQLGFVMQDTVLLRGTVADNIAFGRPDATDAQIRRAAEAANADEFIRRMPMGYDSIIGDRGATLSGGQRQRIGIARALIRDNPILILDEPTAALDAQSEDLVIDALDRLVKDRTVIAVAHRLSTLRDADRIVVVKDGMVAETGSHQHLLGLGGIYTELHRLQFGSRTPTSPSTGPMVDGALPPTGIR